VIASKKKPPPRFISHNYSLLRKTTRNCWISLFQIRGRFPMRPHSHAAQSKPFRPSRSENDCDPLDVKEIFP
jgi:hypothetical protein